MSQQIMVTGAKAIEAAGAELSVEAIVSRKRKILHVLEAVMQDGVHYGKIPGCGDKPTLHKAGAEVLATTFGLAPHFSWEKLDLGGGHREYIVTCTLRHIASGVDLGEGLGSCSTMESKYRWRGGGRSCPVCGAVAIIKGKAEYGGGWLCYDKKGGCGAKWQDGAAEIESQSGDRRENPDIADAYNTVLKMAKKRAQVDATLTAVGASDVLNQDLEDLPVVDQDDEPVFSFRPMADRQPGRQEQHRSQSARGAAAAAPTAAPLSADEVVEVITAIGQASTEAGLKEIWRTRIQPAAAAMEQGIRDKIGRAYTEQQALIRKASREEQGGSR